MKNVRVDAEGEFRCWNCGNKGLIAKRTLRSKALVGVGALLTKKKLKCQTCGVYNDVGNAKPFVAPEGRKWRKQWERQQAAKSAATIAAEERAAQANAAALVAEAAAQQPQAEAPAPAELAPEADMDDPAPAVEIANESAEPERPAEWLPDPSGRHEYRWWTGTEWSDQVSDAGVVGTDPPTPGG